MKNLIMIKNYILKKIAEKIIGRNISDIELDNIINRKDHRTYKKLIMDYYNISYNKKNKYCKLCLIKKAYYGNSENKIKLYGKNCESENDVNLNKSLCIIENCIGVKYKSKFCIYHYENYKNLI